MGVVAALSIPFTLRRPWLMMSQWLTDRDQPDLERLRGMADPERFVWAILPHAARTFASCIALLPSDKARAAAVGYLYCRSLDTYEDLAREPKPLLDAFGKRFEDGHASSAPVLPDPHVQDMRDRAHLLLVEHIDRVDAVYEQLDPEQRASIARCVRDMAVGMQDDDHERRLLSWHNLYRVQNHITVGAVVGNHDLVFLARLKTERAQRVKQLVDGGRLFLIDDQLLFTICITHHDGHIGRPI